MQHVYVVMGRYNATGTTEPVTILRVFATAEKAREYVNSLVVRPYFTYGASVSVFKASVAA